MSTFLSRRASCNASPRSLTIRTDASKDLEKRKKEQILYSEKDRNYKLKLKTLEEKIKFDKDDQEEKSKKIQKASKNNVELKSKAEAQTLIEKEKS
jgi:hypothetical protein